MIFPFYLFVYFCDFGTGTATGFPIKRTPKMSSITEVLVRKGVIRRLCRPELMIFLARRYHPVAASPVPYVGTLSRRVPSRASPTCRWDPPNHSRSYVQYSSPSPVSVYEIIHRCSTRAGVVHVLGTITWAAPYSPTDECGDRNKPPLPKPSPSLSTATLHLASHIHETIHCYRLWKQ